MDLINFDYLNDPQKFESSPNNIWTTSELEELVFQSYFTSSIEGGSENEKKINETIDFINEHYPPNKFLRILDLGCGPGFYSHKLAKLGYIVTGVDISQKALDYAETKSKEDNLDNLSYLKTDILNFNIEESYDIILLLYFTYSNFSKKDRMNILKNIKKTLKPGGTFILDVGTTYRFNQFKYFNYWEKSDAFPQLSKSDFLLLGCFRLYEDCLLLHKQVLFFKNGSALQFLDWQKHFSIKEIYEELVENDFLVLNIFGDSLGQSTNDKNEQLYVVCQYQ